MNILEKTMDSYAEELLKNHNNTMVDVQKNLLTKEDYIEILKPVIKLFNSDYKLDEIRDILFENSGLEESVKDFIYNKKMVPGATISYGTDNF